MRKYTHYLDEETYPVIEFRRKVRYINGEKSNIFDSGYTILNNYEQVVITVEDDGTVVTQEQIKAAADAGMPIELVFKDVEITVRPKNQWEIQASGRASQATVAKSKSTGEHGKIPYSPRSRENRGGQRAEGQARPPLPRRRRGVLD